MLVVISLKRFRKSVWPVIEGVLVVGVLGYLVLKIVQYFTL